MMSTREAGVFLSYRRADSAGHAGRIFDRLAARLGHERVFMDVDGIEPGADFVDRIEQTLARARVVLVVIGPGWLDASLEGSTRRLDDSGDHVRREVELALERSDRVIPVCVQGAAMPTEAQLPASLAALARRSASIIDDSRFDADVDHLVRAVADTVGTREAIAKVTSRAGNVPAPVATVIGIDDPVAAVRSALRSSRLVTVTGAGGCGKTTLALEVAREPIGSFDEAWFVPLADVSGGRVLDAVATSLEVSLDLAATPVDSIVQAIGRRELLLVMDNCEHLLDDVVELLDALLPRCRSLSVLATSRESLAMAGETIVPILPLSLPSRGASRREILASPSARLFLDRARGADPEFQFGEHDHAALAEVCVLLDGLPLAIELVAARIRAFTLSELADGLARSITELTGLRRGGLAHHRTIEACIDWSYGQLDADQQGRFDRLAVFRGGFAPDATRQVAGLHESDLQGLVERSLLVRSLAGAGHRFRLLEPVRQYAEGHLVQRHELDAARTELVSWMRSFVERAGSGLHGAASEGWSVQLRDEMDNVCAALDHCVHVGDSRTIVETLGTLFFICDEIPGAVEFLDVVLTDPAISGDLRLLGMAQATRAEVSMMQSDLGHAEAWAARAVATARSSEDPVKQLMAAWSIGVVTRVVGDAVGADTIHRDAIELANLADEPVWVLLHRHCLGMALLASGSSSAAKEAFLTDLGEATAVGAVMHRSAAVAGLGRVALIEGNAQAAERYFREAVAGMGSFDDRSIAWTGLGDAARARDDLKAALAAYGEGLETLGSSVSQTGYMLAGRVAAVLIHMGRREEAATIMGAVAVLGSAAIEAGPWGPDPEVIAAFETARRDDSLVDQLRAGEQTGPAKAVELALEAIAHTRGLAHVEPSG